MHAEDLGRWWPFLLAAMSTYGLVPRLLVLLICLWRQRVALCWCLMHMPGAADVLDRMNSPIVETAATDALSSTRERPAPVPGESAMRSEPVPLPEATGSSHAVCIKWANVPVHDSDVRQHIRQQLDVQVMSIWNASAVAPMIAISASG